MDEGFEETLTLHRLGLFSELGVSLKTTNILESIHARVGDTWYLDELFVTIQGRLRSSAPCRIAS